MRPLSVAAMRSVVAGRPSIDEAGAEKSCPPNIALPRAKSLAPATVQAASA
jgi:hypothetical protein